MPVALVGLSFLAELVGVSLYDLFFSHVQRLLLLAVQRIENFLEALYSRQHFDDLFFTILAGYMECRIVSVAFECVQLDTSQDEDTGYVLVAAFDS
mgnify:CR=1 FL=1